jgi:hypothetical protein
VQTLSITGHAREPELDVTSIALWLSGTPFNIARFLKRASSLFKFSTHSLDQLQFLIGSARCFRAFQSGKKGPRGFRRRSKSGEETPWEGSDSGGHRLSCFANQKGPNVDGAQFLLTIFCSRFIFRRADMSDRAPANYVGRASAFRLDYLCALVPLCACFRRNAPAILIASATNRSWVSASDSPVMAVILRSNMIDAPPATSLQVKVRARIGVTSCPSIFG